MSLPKVIFEKLSIEDNLNELVWYLKPENSKNSPLDFYKFSLRLFPELDGKIKEDMSYSDIYNVIDVVVRPVLEKFQRESNDEVIYQGIWDKVGDAVLLDLEKKLDIKWNPDTKIVGRVGMLPVCPRDIMGKSFILNYGRSEDEVVATCVHEICHFLYFEKWKQLYPNYTEEEFDSPHIAWYLSEAMIDPILNNDTFKKYTKDDLAAYSVFYETFIEGKSIIDILRSYVSDMPIDEVIKCGYELFKKYENLIKNS